MVTKENVDRLHSLLHSNFIYVVILLLFVLLFWQGTVLQRNIDGDYFQTDALRSIVMTDPDSVLVCGEDQRILIANESAADLLHMSIPMLHAHCITDFMRPEIGAEHYKKYAAVIEYSRTMNISNFTTSHNKLYGILVYRDKSIQPIQIWVSVIKSDDHIIAVAHIDKVSELPDGWVAHIVDAENNIMPEFIPNKLPVLIEPAVVVPPN